MANNLAALVSFAAALGASGCQNCDPSPPRFLDESAKADIDHAELVFVGKVRSIDGDAPSAGSVGIRQIGVTVIPDLRLKGNVPKVVQFIYHQPYGAFEGRSILGLRGRSRGFCARRVWQMPAAGK